MFDSGRFVLALFYMGIAIGFGAAHGLPWLWSVLVKPFLRWLVL